MRIPFISSALVRRRAKVEIREHIADEYLAALDENARLHTELEQIRQAAAEVAETGFAVLVRESAIQDAAHHFAQIFDDGMLASMVGTSFTCTEVDAIAGLLIAAGREDAGLSWLECHAEGDEHDDSHYQGTETWDHEEPQPTPVDLAQYAHDLAA
jgi:hypothetical protein